MQNIGRELTDAQAARVFFYALADDAMIDAWEGCTEVTEEIYRRIRRLIWESGSGELFVDMCKKFPQFISGEDTPDMNEVREFAKIMQTV